jgi:hypothetical protein
MEQEEEGSLIEKVLAGNDDAFAQLFQRYYSFLYKYLLKLQNSQLNKRLIKLILLNRLTILIK